MPVLSLVTYSEKEHYHGQDDIKSAAPFFNQSNCVIYALIQSEMEPQTSGLSVRNNAIFKTMCLVSPALINKIRRQDNYNLRPSNYKLVSSLLLRC